MLRSTVLFSKAGISETKALCGAFFLILIVLIYNINLCSVPGKTIIIWQSK